MRDHTASNSALASFPGSTAQLFFFAVEPGNEATLHHKECHFCMTTEVMSLLFISFHIEVLTPCTYVRK